MCDAIHSGGADAIAMGRALIADPFLPRKVTAGKAGKIMNATQGAYDAVMALGYM